MKRIAVLTSGGDAPGMNACIRAVIRTCLSMGIEPFIIHDGYKGLVENNMEKVSRRYVSETINRGGTIIGTARYEEFKKEEVIKVAVSNLKNKKIDGLITIGGDGTFRGAIDLKKYGVKCVGVGATIDNDVNIDGYTIGFDTALNTIVDNLDKIRDTSSSHHRCSIVEVMGRHCGDLALYSGLASGADIIITKDNLVPKKEMYEEIRKMKKEGRRHVLIVTSENVLDINKLKDDIEKHTDFETRATSLGPIQRGGKPSAMDRVNGSLLGSEAVKMLLKDEEGMIVSLRGNKLAKVSFNEAVKNKIFANEYMYEAAKRVG